MKEAVVVVPIYKEITRSEDMLSIKRTLNILNEWDIVFLCPKSLKKYALDLASKFEKKIKIDSYQNKFFMSVKGYNSLMLSRDFYKNYVDYKYMQIVQIDAIVIEDKLKFWCEMGYSYIGAPIFKGFSNPQIPLEVFAVGNGGFSLRKIADFIKILENIRYIPNIIDNKHRIKFIRLLSFIKNKIIFSYNINILMPKVNEDIFWCVLVPRRFENFSIPEFEIGALYSFDAEPRHLYNLTNKTLPFGCHAWEKYDKSFWIDVLSIHDASKSTI